MARRWPLLAALVLEMALAAWSVRTPRPAPVDLPPTAFSAQRAMQDVRAIAQRPRLNPALYLAEPQASRFHRIANLRRLNRCSQATLASDGGRPALTDISPPDIAVQRPA